MPADRSNPHLRWVGVVIGGLDMKEQKSRQTHESARGKKIPKLSDLSREMPNEDELENFSLMLASESSDRSAAIMAAGLLEHALYASIAGRLADPGKKILNDWFQGPNAPFGTFSAKIKLGRALGIYGPKMESALNAIKEIRNVFAHRSTPIDFNHPAIAKEVRRLFDEPLLSEGAYKTRYCASCLAFSQKLVDDAFENGGKEIAVKFP